MQVLHICSAVCSFVSLLFLLLALGSDYWVVNGLYYGGLWKTCNPFLCIIYGMNVKAADHAVRAFMFLGMIAGAVSFFGLCASFFKSEVASMSLTKTSANASILAALFAMIAMAVFTGVLAGSTISYGWSFGLGWASFPLFLITGVLCYLSRSGLSDNS